MMRYVKGRSFDIVPIFLALLAYAFVGFLFGWLFVFILAWVAFRLWWFYRSAVRQDLFDG